MTPLEARLAALAAQGQTVAYGVLARELGVRIGELTAALEALMATDARDGRPLRASLCEGRLAGGMPARGFFERAADLGYDIGDRAEFVAGMRARLFNGEGRG